MATKKPRITITLDHGVYALLRAIAQVHGRPMSALVSELVEAAAPVMERVAVLTDAAKKADKGKIGEFVRRLEIAESQIHGAMGSMVGQLDWVLETSKQFRSAASQKGKIPRAVTTGVRSGLGTKNQALAKGAKKARKGV